MENQTISKLGFISGVAGLLGLLLGRFLFFIFPIPLICGFFLIKRQTSLRDMISGVTCLLIACILFFYLFVTK
jgi:hypothetical protein